MTLEQFEFQRPDYALDIYAGDPPFFREPAA
jgi:hypothetical protein